MKAPQKRKTEKRIYGEERENMGYAPITLSGNDERLVLIEQNESKDVIIFRSREEIETIRDFCNAWLEHHDEEQSDE